MDKETQDQINELKNQIANLLDLITKDEYSNIKIFRKQVVFKAGVTGIFTKQTAITPPSGGTIVDSQARTAISDIITKLQNLGLTN